jgi:hypothetical protein
MVTTALLALIILLLLSLAFTRSTKAGTLKATYLALAWVPLASFVLLYLWQQSLGYVTLALLLVTVLTAFVLGIVGSFVTLRAYRHGEPYASLLVATFLASFPAILFVTLAVAGY